MFNPSRPDPGQREKIDLNFYFHPFLWCLKRFYAGESVKEKLKLIFILIQLSEIHGAGRVNKHAIPEA